MGIEGEIKDGGSVSCKQRLSGLRNYQSKDFWAMLFARPACILMLLPVADAKWVTPNRITVAAVLVKLVGAIEIFHDFTLRGAVLGAILVNIGLVLDNMDGTLARYRNSSTYLGYYADKASDIVCLIMIFAAMAWRAYTKSGMQIDAWLPLLGFGGAAISGYCKWVYSKVVNVMELHLCAAENRLGDYAAANLEQNPSESPPPRTAKDWSMWFLGALKSILYFNEVDIFFFVGLALVLECEWIFTRYVCFFYSLGAVVVPVYFGIKLARQARAMGLR